MAEPEPVRPEVVPPPTPPGTEVEVTTRSGVPVVVVAERVGLPYRVRPMALSLVVVLGVLAVLFAVSWDDGGGEEPAGIVALGVQLALFVAAALLHVVVSPVQRWVVRRASDRWKVGVVASDPGRAPRGQWVLHSERLPAGADPRARLDALVEEVRSGAFDVHRRVLGIRASLR